MLRFLLLGGFEVWHKSRKLDGFESRKTRALLAYLALKRGRMLSRDQLAGLLWPEASNEAARRNIRQALYNLNSVLAGTGGSSPILVEAASVTLDRGPQLWVDVEAFKKVLGQGRVPVATVATHALSQAASLYRGDLLAGFFVSDSPEFESWMTGEQELLRRLALEALDALAERSLARGEPALGIPYARRLVAMDQFAERSHRLLMSLLAMAGERAAALAHYRSLEQLLRQELGVEPLPETKATYAGVLSEALAAATGPTVEAKAGPVIPLVARGDAFAKLSQTWATVLEGQPRLTLVEGEEGVGKTRVIRSFLDAAAAQRPSLVLVGKSVSRFPQLPYRPVVQALSPALGASDDERESLARKLPPAARAVLAALFPGLGPAPRSRSGRSRPPAVRHEVLFDAVALLLRLISRRHAGSGGCQPVVLFLDDLQWADADTVGLILALAARLRDIPVWLLLACRCGDTQTHAGLSRIVESPSSADPIQRIHLDRLGVADVREMARALVGEEDVPGLKSLLVRGGDGLPMKLVALVNSLWDEGRLSPTRAGREKWVCRVGPSDSMWCEQTLDDLIRSRVARLSNSTRRVASLASVLGHEFDVELILRAEPEHKVVVEVALDALRKRYLVRHTASEWVRRDPEERDPINGATRRLERFDFDQDRIREVIRGEISPLRRQVLHRQVAQALESLSNDDLLGVEEDRAYHLVEAREWRLAVGALRRAGDRARDQLAFCSARLSYGRALEAAGEVERDLGKDLPPSLSSEVLNVKRALAGMPSE
ncbi:MAG: AAA family ATPase [Acidobacteria bacterium]|nr:AAA family ATPase [Acidobacteriota bacterium]